MAEVLKAIADVLEHHNQEVLLAQDIFDFAIAPDDTTDRIQQLMEEAGYDVKEVEEVDTFIYQVDLADGSQYHVFDEYNKDEAIRYNLEGLEDLLPDSFKNFLDDRITNMPRDWNPLEKLEHCLSIFSDYMNDLHEHYDTVDWIRDEVYERDYYVCKRW